MKFYHYTVTLEVAVPEGSGAKEAMAVCKEAMERAMSITGVQAYSEIAFMEVAL